MTAEFIEFIKYHTGLEKADIKKFRFGTSFDLIELWCKQSNKSYHLSKLNEITEKDILDNYKAISDHTTYDYVKGAKAVINKLKNNAK